MCCCVDLSLCMEKGEAVSEAVVVMMLKKKVKLKNRAETSDLRNTSDSNTEAAGGQGDPYQDTNIKTSEV